MNTRFKSDFPSVQPLPATPAANESKQYLHSIVAAVTVPTLQAAITFIFIFLGVGVLCWLVFDIVDPWKPAVFLAVLASLGVFFARLWQWAILTTEKKTGIDINGDGVIGPKPEKEYVKIQITDVKDNGHVEIKQFQLSASDDQLQKLAIGLLRFNRKFSEKEWAGPGKPFSINEFRDLRSEMIKRGLLAQANSKDPRQGYALTHAGKAVLRHYLPSPSPDLDGPETV